MKMRWDLGTIAIADRSTTTTTAGGCCRLHAHMGLWPPTGGHHRCYPRPVNSIEDEGIALAEHMERVPWSKWESSHAWPGERQGQMPCWMWSDQQAVRSCGHPEEPKLFLFNREGKWNRDTVRSCSESLIAQQLGDTPRVAAGALSLFWTMELNSYVTLHLTRWLEPKLVDNTKWYITLIHNLYKWGLNQTCWHAATQ
jgi:hypothetical protein